MLLGNGIAAGSSPLTGVGSLLVVCLACLAGVDIFASGVFWSLGRSEEVLISEIREFVSFGCFLDLEQSLKHLGLGRA